MRKAERRLKNGKTGRDDGIVDELVNYGVEVVVSWLFEVLTA